MNMFILKCSILSFIYYAQLTESLDAYWVKERGHLGNPPAVAHVAAKDMTPMLRDRLVRLVNAILGKPGSEKDIETLKSTDRSNKKHKDFRNVVVKSPVIYSNGRYTLDLDRVEFRDQHGSSHHPDDNIKYIDPSESEEHNYDYEDSNENYKKKKMTWHEFKHLSKYLRSSRKYNELLGDEKYFRSRDLNSKEDRKVKKKKKYSQKKRFQIINNNDDDRDNGSGESDETWKNKDDSDEKTQRSGEDSNESKHLKASKKKKTKYESDSYKQSDKELSSEEKVKKHKRKKKDKYKKTSEEDENVDDDEMYLQGNVLIKVGPKRGRVDSDSGSDGEESDLRRRLPHFLPKRYHWEPSDIHKLGYFWFNGPKGKYPAPRLAD